MRRGVQTMCASFTYWQDANNGMWLGYWNDYPDYQTEGSSLDELKRMLVSLRTDIREMVAEGVMPDCRRNEGRLAYA